MRTKMLIGFMGEGGCTIMGNKVVKFGGSSLADAGQVAKVREIIRADAARLFVVPSAPGKRFSDDVKVTDCLLYTSRCV